MDPVTYLIIILLALCIFAILFLIFNIPIIIVLLVYLIGVVVAFIIGIGENIRRGKWYNVLTPLKNGLLYNWYYVYVALFD